MPPAPRATPRLVAAATLLFALGCAPERPPAAEPEPEREAADSMPLAGGATDAESVTAPPREGAREPGAPATAPVEDLREAARAVAVALRDRDFAGLAESVHPTGGARFSPYSYVEPESHLELSAEELRAAAETGEGEVRAWGHHDGSGEPIRKTLREYVDRFVYDAPYLEEGEVAVDERQGHGNSLDNSAEVYPDARIVEYHLPGRDPRYGGMDWRSLRLVFEPAPGGGWWLVGVIHDEWTI